jgi:hypothetical protein
MMRCGIINATVFAITMANVEAMIVVYLRRIYYPQGFAFPLVFIDHATLLMELTREACTLGMLVAFGIAAGRVRVERLAFFLFAFGVWDIFYYLWLKLLLNWPASLFTWDVLFLIPVPWIGPVLAPISVACTMIGMGLGLLYLEVQGPVLPAGRIVWQAQVVAALIIILSFIIDVIPHIDAQGTGLRGWTPTAYRWWMLVCGQALAIGTFVHWAWRTQQAQR